MTTARAQSESFAPGPEITRDDTLYPGTRGHIMWLRDERKNKLFSNPEKMTPEDDLELLFAYSTHPEKLQHIKGSKATAIIRKFGLNLSHEREMKLADHATAQLQIFLKTLTVPKKPTAAPAPRKPAARPTKRRSSTR